MTATVHAVVAPVVAQLPRIPVAMLRRLVWLLLLLYGCNIVARVFWLMLPLPDAPGSVAIVQSIPGSGPANAPTQSVTVDIAALESLHLFGKAAVAGQTTVAVRPPIIEAEKTRLELLLLGVMVSPDSSAARAIIAHRNQQDLFAVGDELPGGVQVQLEQVLPGRVIINNAGRYESLWLYEDTVRQSQPQHRLAARSSMPAPARIESTGALQPAAKPEAVTADARSKGTAAVAKGDPLDLAVLLESDRSKITADSLADIIQFTPVHANGRILGYRIAPGRAPELFKRFGLKKNDVITSVNGVPLDDPTRALKVYRQIQGSRAANFELMRDGESHAVDVVLDKKRG